MITKRFQEETIDALHVWGRVIAVPSVTQSRIVDAVMVDITDLNHQMFHHQKKKDVDDVPETKLQV